MGPRRVRSVRWIIGAAGIAVGGLLLALGVSQSRQSAWAARLPPLPDLAGQPDAVRAHLTDADRAARANPQSAALVGALGLAYHADMDYARAVRSYALAEALDPAAWRWTYYRAVAHGMNGDAVGERDALSTVVAKTPSFAPAWWRLGEAEFKVRRYDEAILAWRQAQALPEPRRSAPPDGAPAPVASVPIRAYAGLGLARVALARGEAERAVETLQRVTTDAPEFGPAFRLLSDAYLRLRQVDDSQRMLRLADRRPRYAPYLDPLFEALVYESQSTTFLLQQAASADLTTNASWREYLDRRVLALDPNHPDALFDLGTMYRVLQRYDDALMVLERYRDLVPDDYQVVADIGRCLSGLRRYAEAEPMLREALVGLDTADTRYDLGLVLDRLGRRTEATAEYRLALDRDPNHPDALNNLGVVLASQGQLNQAVPHFERLVAIDPDNADAHANLGVVLLGVGAQAPAAAAFSEALRLSPTHARAREGLRQLGEGAIGRVSPPHR